MYFTQKQIVYFGYNFAQRNLKKIPKKVGEKACISSDVLLSSRQQQS